MGLTEMAARAELEKERKARLAELGGVEKTAPAAWLAWLVTGWIGGHRFYLRKHGALMLAWFVLGIVILEVGSDTLAWVWFASVLAWWVLDAFLIPHWLDDFKRPYERALKKLEREELTEAMTLPLMRAAQKHGGSLTVAQGVLATGLTLVQVEQCLMEMSASGYVQIENADDGNLIFDFGDMPEYDEDEAVQEALAEGHAMATLEMAEALEEAEKEQRREGTRSAVKHGLVAGAAMFGARALLGEVFDDDDE